MGTNSKMQMDPNGRQGRCFIVDSLRSTATPLAKDADGKKKFSVGVRVLEANKR